MYGLVYLSSVDVDRVVVESGVPDQSGPLVPALGHVTASVFIQVFPKVTCNDPKRKQTSVKIQKKEDNQKCPQAFKD